MSARNSRQAKSKRRHERSIRHVGGCSICTDTDVVYIDPNAPDPTYRAICRRHLAFAVATIFGYDGPGTFGPSPWRRHINAIQKEEAENWTVLDDYPPSHRLLRKPDEDDRGMVVGGPVDRALWRPDERVAEVEH